MIRKNPNIKVYNKQELKEKLAAEKMLRKQNREAGSLAAILMPVIILGSIYGGVLTPTESAALSVAYSIPVSAFVYKQLTWRIIKNSFTRAAVTTGVVMLLMITVQMLSRLYIMQNLPAIVLNFLTSISGDKHIILLMINIFMIILGMLMDDGSAVLLATPIMVPVVTALGISQIHFAAILAVNLGMGCITPPTAPCLFLAGRMTNTEIRGMLKPTLVYILFAWLPTLALVTYIPKVALFLPGLMGY